MNDELRKYLTDVLMAISDIESFVGEKKNFNHFRKSALLRAAVERKIGIIGEAMNNALRINENLLVSNARRIVNTRNKIVHGYDEVDELLIWEIVVKHLPVLKGEVIGLLSA